MAPTHISERSERVQQASSRGSVLRLLSLSSSVTLCRRLQRPLGGGWRSLARAQQRVMWELGVAGSGRRLLAVHAAGERMRLAARAKRPGTGAHGRRYGGPAVARIRVHRGGNEIGTGAGQPPLEVVGLRAAEGGSWAEVAQVVGTRGHGVLTVLQRDEGTLGWRMMVVVVVALLL